MCTLAKSSSKSPELLARYADSLLKKSAKVPEEKEMENLLNDIVSFFLFSYSNFLDGCIQIC